MVNANPLRVGFWFLNQNKALWAYCLKFGDLSLLEEFQGLSIVCVLSSESSQKSSNFKIRVKIAINIRWVQALIEITD